MNDSISLNDFTIKQARPEDASLILDFIRLIADYEKLSHEVVADIDSIRNVFFCENPKVFCVIGYHRDRPVGYAVYFFNFSTFLAKHGLYLEDLFVMPEYRGNGFGKALLLHLTQVALQHNCGRMEWAVLDWNTPAIEFYKSLLAQSMDEWTVFRINEAGLRSLND
jgi:GNAT superfamily N-acetyltransferase